MKIQATKHERQIMDSLLWLLAQRSRKSFLEDDKNDDVQEKGWENHLFSAWDDTKCESTEKIEY